MLVVAYRVICGDLKLEKSRGRETRTLEYIFIISSCIPLYPGLYPAVFSYIQLHPAVSSCIQLYPAISALSAISSYLSLSIWGPDIAKNTPEHG